MRLLLPSLLLIAPLAAQGPVSDLRIEYDRMAIRPLWPGFSPESTALAIYDGHSTWLFRHPAPPAGFVRDVEMPDTYVMSGRHTDVRANTHVELGGVPTATLLLPDHPVSLTRLAAVLIHEAFHVYQARIHPTWYGNEATLFTYPVTDSAAQQLQRLETDAFRRALLPTGQASCWASRAMALRQARVRRISAEAMSYERGNDLNEGLATYVEWRASGAPLDSLIPPDGFAPDAMRLRAYAVGPAQAFLLDHLQADWIGALTRDSMLTLDALLGRAVAPISCRADFTTHEIDSTGALAGRESAGVLTARAELRRSFLARPGWTLVILLPDATPLWPERFDPLNLTPLADGEVLHQRHLRLSGERGRLEIQDQWALTVPAGAHPLFNGVRSVLMAGLAEHPTLTITPDSLLVRGPGIEGAFTGMTVVEAGQQVTVRPR
ncbi:MAG: hypothetical protein ABI587_00310 [Gemmatimonadales bacterium]